MASVHRETFTGLVQQHGWTRGAELGVDKGILFGMLLRECQDLHLIGVDTFPDSQRSHRVPELVAQFANRATVLAERTDTARFKVPDFSLDFVFIDADHSEKSVDEDIFGWFHKVRTNGGGWFGGHDYSPKFPGVVKAVNRAFGKSVQTWPGNIWGVWV